MQNNTNLSIRILHIISTTIIIQLHSIMQRLNNATTTTQQNATYYACSTNRATAPFANAL